MRARDAELEQQILALHKEGCNQQQIIDALHVGDARIRRVFRANGISVKGNDLWSETELQTLYQLHFIEKMRIVAIAKSGKLAGRSTSAISTILSKMRVEEGRFVPIARQEVSDDYWQRKADEQARLAAIPQDTRGKTAYLMGDPIRERSALYQKQQAEKVVPLRRAS